MSSAKLPRAPLLTLITDLARLRGRPLEDVVDAAVAGGADVVQLRNADASRAELLRDALTLRDVIRGRALLFVNGDAGVALEARTDGVHFPERMIATTAPGGLLVSRAVHSAPAARAAEVAGATFLQAGSVFASMTHPGGPVLGLEGLREICAAVRSPVVAVGGITARNAADVLTAGAAGIAVIGAILDAPDTRGAAAEVVAAIRARALA